MSFQRRSAMYMVNSNHYVSPVSKISLASQDLIVVGKCQKNIGAMPYPALIGGGICGGEPTHRGLSLLLLVPWIASNTHHQNLVCTPLGLACAFKNWTMRMPGRHKWSYTRILRSSSCNAPTSGPYHHLLTERKQIGMGSQWYLSSRQTSLFAPIA